MMKQKELKSLSDRTLEEMRINLSKIIEQFPNRNNEYIQHVLNTICEEIVDRNENVEMYD
jgi:hypothetical protein